MHKYFRHFLAVFSILTSTFLFSSQAFAQWVQTSGPNGGQVSCFAGSGSNLFAGTNSGGVFLTRDAGVTWETVNTGLPTNYVRSLCISGTSIFVGTDSGVFRSIDNGSHWSASGLKDSSVNALFASGSTLLAATYNYPAFGVFYSLDQGATWKEANGQSDGVFIYCFAAVGNTLFSGSYSGVSVSTDNGANWASTNQGLAPGTVYSLATIPTSNGGINLIAGVNKKVYLSTDTGATWINATGNLSSGLVLSLATAFGGGVGYIFASPEKGVFVSSDNGNSWIAGSTGLKYPLTGTVIKNSTDLFVSSGPDVWRRPLSEFGAGTDRVAQSDPIRITISPNPTTGIVIVHNTALVAAHITITNLLGVNVMVLNEPAATEFTLDLSKLISGAYILKFSNGGSVTTQMIVRQ